MTNAHDDGEPRGCSPSPERAKPPLVNEEAWGYLLYTPGGPIQVSSTAPDVEAFVKEVTGPIGEDGATILRFPEGCVLKGIVFAIVALPDEGYDDEEEDEEGEVPDPPYRAPIPVPTGPRGLGWGDDESSPEEN